MAYSYVQYNGTGAQVLFVVSFPYLLKSHVHVKVGGVETTAFVWVSATSIQLTVAPVLGVLNVDIRRSTPLDAPLVIYADGGAEFGSDLNTSFLQTFYAMQELQELPAAVVPTGHSIQSHSDTQAGDSQAKGVALLYDGGGKVRSLAPGSNGAMVVYDSTQTLGAKASPAIYVAKGDLAIATAASSPGKLSVGADGTILEADSAEVTGWKAGSAPVKASLVTTKGDIIVATGNAAVARHAAGTAGQVPRANAIRSDGLEYGTSCLPETFRGLSLRTHPDYDLSATNVIMPTCKYLVLENGVRVKPRKNLIANIAGAVGAGALDTGAKVNSTWYEVYYLFKYGLATPDDPDAPANDALILHRAKDWFLDQAFQTARDGVQPLRDAAGTTKVAQGVIPATAGFLPWFDMNITRVGTIASGGVWLTIEGDNAGSPNGTPIATSQKVGAVGLTTAFPTALGVDTAASGVNVRFVFSTPPTLTNGVQYHVVLQGDYAISGANYLQAGGVLAGGYTNGSCKKFDGASWTASATTLDLNFRMYIERNNTALVMPATHDQKCLIGYVVVDATGNFQKFIQQDRSVVYSVLQGTPPAAPGINYLGQVGNGAAGANYLIDLGMKVPPSDVPAVSISSHSTGAAGYVFVNPSDFVGIADTTTSAYAWQRSHFQPPAYMLYQPIPCQSNAVVLGILTVGTYAHVAAYQW